MSKFSPKASTELLCEWVEEIFEEADQAEETKETIYYVGKGLAFALLAIHYELGHLRQELEEKHKS